MGQVAVDQYKVKQGKHFKLQLSKQASVLKKQSYLSQHQIGVWLSKQLDKQSVEKKRHATIFPVHGLADQCGDY